MNIPGIKTYLCQGSMDEVWQRLLAALYEANVPIFASIDHAANAEEAGLHMPASRVLIFGNAAVGTLLMQAAPAAALDLPLRAHVMETAEGVRFSCVEAQWIAARYALDSTMEAVTRMDAFLQKITEQVIKP